MNICMFTNTYLPHVGGVARSVANFTEDLRKNGHHVLIVAPTFPDRKPGQDADEVLRVPAIQNFNGSDFSFRIPLPFIINEKIDDFKPDIIHSHHPFLLGDAAMRAAYRRDLPLIFTHHTLYEQYTHYVSQSSAVMKRFAIKLSTLYANLCYQVVAPSDSISRLIADRGVKRPIEIIPTGIDFEFFRQGRGDRFRKRFGISEDARVIGHLGRIAPEKNLGYLAEAVALAMQQDEEAWFLVVGDGPSEAEIRKIFEKSGLSGRLVMAGKQTGENLRDAYHAMDLFAFASKSETQGMVLAEAMAAGAPVIALDAPGAREVVQDGENGRLLAESAETQAFAEAVNGCLRDSENAKKWRLAAIETAESFSRENSAQKMIKLYNRIREKEFDHLPSPLPEAIIPWDSLQRAIKAEWELLSQKATAFVETLQVPPGNASEE
ncbi:MAG TPA: glycosyltransferase [Desulfosalsimonadaceae bacterium]|nr:glycosyltransferase [Desulfosalsimonadaceae bacterium]